MLTDASRWPSRWWRWTETRWPGSSGSSSRRRWSSAELHHTDAGAGLRPGRARAVSLEPIFKSGAEHVDVRGGVLWEIICAWWWWWRGEGFVMFHPLIGWLAHRGQMVNWLAVDQPEITNLWCDNWQVVFVITQKFSKGEFLLFREFVSLVGMQQRKTFFYRAKTMFRMWNW